MIADQTVATELGAIDDVDVQLEHMRTVASELRARRGAIELSVLCDCMPDLRSSAVLFDAAIELVVRDMTGAGHTVSESLAILMSNYPEDRHAIAMAGCLACIFDSSLSMTEPPPSFEPGDRVGTIDASGQRRYEIVDEQGRGSFGVVYRAIDRWLSDEEVTANVAIKIVRSNQAGGVGPLAEASRPAAINHPNVIAVYDTGAVDSTWSYVAMELVSSGSLWEHRELGVRQIVRIMRDAAYGVHAVHSAGVVHGDLKPANILVQRREGEGATHIPKVSDFGASRRLTVGAAQHSGTDVPSDVAGNLAFMAPEVLEGQPPSIQSDVYALAAITQYILTGTLSDLVCEHASPHRESDTRRLPRRLQSMLRTATSIVPGERPESASQLAHWLDVWLTNRVEPRVDPFPTRVRLAVMRHPAITAGLILTLVFASVAAVTAQRAREGIAYRNGVLQATATLDAWREAARPAFSVRTSVYDLASRSALRGLVSDDNAMSDVFNKEADLDARIAEAQSLLDAISVESTDSLLLRERVLFLRIQSHEFYDDTFAMIDHQRDVLTQFGLLVPSDAEQLDVFEAICRVKHAVITEQWSVDSIQQASDVLYRFLIAQPKSSTGSLAPTARRDPRVRLAARALHWASSPKILDEAHRYAWIDQEY